MEHRLNRMAVAAAFGLAACGGDVNRGSAGADASAPDAAPRCDGTWCGADCADLANDSRHCGACGYDCGGGGCVESTCQRIVELAPSDNSAFYANVLAVNDRDVVWTESFKVSRCAKWGCGRKASVVVPASDVDSDVYYAIAADDTNVYWGAAPMHGGFAGILFCPIAGCTTRVVFAAEPRFANAGVPSPIETYRGFVYFNGLECPSSGCGAGANASKAGGGDRQTMGPADLYWAPSTETAGTTAIMTCPLSGCAGTPRVVVDQLADIDVLAADAINVYWIEHGGSVPPPKGRILMCPVSGCASPVVVATDQPYPTSIATDGVNVYWTNLGTLRFSGFDGGPAQPGGVMSCPVGGCGSGPTVAAESPAGAFSIALDAKSFYWIESRGAIMRSAK